MINSFRATIQHPISLKIFALAAVLILCGAKTEAQGKPARIGYLDDGSAAGSAEVLEAFRKQMTQLN